MYCIKRIQTDILVLKKNTSLVHLQVLKELAIPKQQARPCEVRQCGLERRAAVTGPRVSTCFGYSVIKR